ncbi:NAD-dependent epimerase/dehydratase family protein [Aliivibrio salmonicida]|uniref:NAD dependent epimerase/dehydratase n=1 Tax=Aliivibrio salmonicida (strain LFI1238) TaxID=316275 RepID=B6EHD6_ALISL|nr:NAD-dependent epimerase/dehydratase family protein [Aliivibrio salmonicida]AZL83578.1 NAD-dependent epimerase/dehydratase family protein [Aliivibrio salmonicida]AZL86091.1 NAD-dependent epimerase/dehydratase family protein [Aliivibrio salmonicida]CAQ80713.1 putative NAD dependent epimerase/dehydratase [Aliivibrio salmonicida LFI1238]
MTKNVLITGGAGFIGSNLALDLIDKGCNVTVLDNLSPQIHGENPELSPLYCSIKGKVRFIQGTVESRDDWLEALKDIDTVVHLAAETGTGQSMYQIKKYSDINIGGSAIFLDLLANEPHNITKMVIASSRSIYGEGKYLCSEHGIVYPNARNDEDMKHDDFNVKCPLCSINVELLATDEESKIHPSSIYGVTKQVQEQMFMITGESLDIPTVSLRFQNVYGAGQSLSNPYTGILSIFSTRIKNGNDINIFEDGLESRDFVYIDDVVDSIVLSIFNENANYQIFNVGSGVCTDVLSVAETLKSVYESSSNILISSNYRVGDIRHNFADLTLIKSKIGFEPKVDFVSGMRKFTAWVNQQEVQADLYESSIAEMKSKGLYK